MIRNLIALAGILALLTGCAADSASPSAAGDASPAQAAENPAPAWASLTPEDLPGETEDLSSFFAKSSPAVCLLGTAEEADVALYGLNPGYGGGILLRDGDTLTLFDQAFSALSLPDLWWADFDEDGGEELAVRFLTEQDDQGGCAYDLAFYHPSPAGWELCSVSRDNCAQLLLTEIETDWDSRTLQLTVAWADRQASCSLPESTDSDPLILGHTCLFVEESGHFSVILDAWVPALSASLAVFRAEILYDGNSFRFQNIRMESDPGV